MRAMKTTSSLKTTRRKMIPRNKRKNDNIPTPYTSNIKNYFSVKKQEDDRAQHIPEDNKISEDHPKREDNLQKEHNEDNLGDDHHEDNTTHLR